MCDFTKKEQILIINAIQFKLSTTETQKEREKYFVILGKF